MIVDCLHYSNVYYPNIVTTIRDIGPDKVELHENVCTFECKQIMSGVQTGYLKGHLIDNCNVISAMVFISMHPFCANIEID